MATVKIVLGADNTLRVAVTAGADYESAKAAIAKLVADLGVDLPIVLDGEIEAHRHSPDEIAAHQQAHAHS